MTPSSPQSPGHSRNSSAAYSQAGSPLARRDSRSSGHELSSSFPNDDLSGLGDGGPSGGLGGGNNGMGNLADELADAFSDMDGDEEAYGDEDHDELGDIQNANQRPSDQESEQDQGRAENLNPPTSHSRIHQRNKSEYDGSEYGSDADLDLSGMLPSLVARIDAVESLARRGTDSYGGPENDVFKRVTDSLRDLGSQSSVESSTSRLITAHASLTTHLAHQTRQIHNLTFPLLSPLVMPPDAETIDELLPLLVSLSETMPRPHTSAHTSLAALHTITSDLMQSLNYVSDTLHMSRQTTVTANRRLKSAKELVAEMRREEELREEGERWLTKGNWADRLEKRECAGVCGEVIGGFEEVCNGWRERLLAQAEPQA